jgi:hypothetical protein
MVLWLALVLSALAVRYPDTFRAANQTARANAALDLLDREIGGGNSVIPDQEVLLEARARIPVNATFAVAVGEPQQGWTDLTATYAETFFRYFLLPRRVGPNAPWILCLACDPNAFPGTRPVWKGENGIVILRRQS